MSTNALPTKAGETKSEIVEKIFHTLAQPLTELHGTLELALLRPLRISEMHDAVAHSIAAVDRITERLYFFRDLADAEVPGATAPMDLSHAVWEAFDEFRPVADDGGIKFEFVSGPEVWIYADPQRVSRALTLIIDWVLAASPRCVRVEPCSDGWQWCTKGASFYSSFAQQCSFELAQALLNTAHCKLQVSDNLVTVTALEHSGSQKSRQAASDQQKRETESK